MEIKKYYDEHGITYTIDGIEVVDEIREAIRELEKIDHQLFNMRKERCKKERNILTLLYGHAESNRIFEQHGYNEECGGKDDAAFYVIPKVKSYNERERILDFESFPC